MALICCVLFAGAANAALVRVGNLVLTADGGFKPSSLPRSTYAPINFDGEANLKAVDGSVPPPLQQLVLDFDRDGRLSTAGLPVCQPAALEEATTAASTQSLPRRDRRHGHASVAIGDEGQRPLIVSSPLTFFNGPRLAGKSTVIMHARIAVLAVQNFVITIPIEKRGGRYRYRATIEIAPDRGRPRLPDPPRRLDRQALPLRRQGNAPMSRPVAGTASSAPTAASPSPTARSSTAASTRPARSAEFAAFLYLPTAGR